MIRPINELYLEINKLIQKEYDNIELKRSLNEEYVSKGLNPKTVVLLFDEKVLPQQLNEIQLIAFCNGVYNIFRNKEYNAKTYFSEAMINSYKNYINVEELINRIKLNNVIRVNDFDYVTVIKYKDLYEYFSSNLIQYNMSIQRYSTFKKLGQEYIKTPTVDMDTIHSIEQTALEGKLEMTQIVLTLLVQGNEIPKIVFKEKIDNMGELIIDEPIYCNEGFHRLTGICSSVAKYKVKTGKWLDGELSVRIVIADKSKAIRIMRQSFLRSNTNQDYLKAITENDVTIFLDKVINQSKLKGHISDTFEECKAMKTYTYRTIMIDILNKCDISYNNKSEVLIKSKKFGEYIDIIIDFMGEFKLIPNLYAMLLYCAYKIDRNNYDGIEIYYKIGEAIEDISEQQIKEWKLEYKTVKLNLVIQYFDNIFKEE